MPTPLTDADKVLRNDTGIDIATNIASIASALTPSNITDLGDVNLTNPITDGQVIKYDTATQKWINGLGNITMECNQAQYDAWKQSGQLKPNTLYVITDAPNLNATAQDISYDGGADTVWDKVEAVGVASAITPTSTKGTFSACYQSIIGDVVTVQGVFACNSNISAGGAVAFTLPYGLKSGTNASNFLMYDNSAGVSIHVRLANNGDVTPVDSMTTHSYRFTFTYLK